MTSARVLLLLVLSSFLLSSIGAIRIEQFKGKVVLVTGGTSGIGFATALKFAQAGAQVAISARDSHPEWYNGAWAENEINKDPFVIQAGGKAVFFRADVSVKQQARDLIARIDQQFGRLDIAINNAAISGPLGNLFTLDPFMQTEQDPIANNLYGTLFSMFAEIQYWCTKFPRGNFSVVNLSSYNGIRGCAGCAMYAASKYGIVGLTASVAVEYAIATPKSPRIRVNAIAPGLIDTPLTRNQVKYIVNGTQPWIGRLISEKEFEPYRQRFEEPLIGKRLGEPVEMANLAMFLSSQEASYISGAVYSADNGLAAV